jgi:hypothetical protein
MQRKLDNREFTVRIPWILDRRREDSSSEPVQSRVRGNSEVQFSVMTRNFGYTFDQMAGVIRRQGGS